MKQPKIIEISIDDKDSLVERIKHNLLIDGDHEILTSLIEFNTWLQFSLQEKSISIWRLQKLFGSSSEKKSRKSNRNIDKATTPGELPADNAENSTMQSDSSVEHISDDNIAEVKSDVSAPIDPALTADNAVKKPWPTNSGRIGHDAYTNAEVVKVSSSYKHGDPCPDGDCNGKLKLDVPKVILKISGGDMAKATKYHLPVHRCSVCEKYFSAELPAHVCKDKYDAKFKAQLCCYRYTLGVPCYRLQEYQKNIGTPLPDSTQHDKTEEVANDLHPVFKHIEILAANASLHHADDTVVKIKALIAKNKTAEKKERTGMFTTGIVAYNNEHVINLFYSGRKHAGENMLKLLEKRNPDLPQPKYMCDALSRNMPKALRAIIINCLVHGRRNFVDIEKHFTVECAFVIDLIGEVYKHDSIIREQNLDEEARLKYHYKHSKPHMDELHAWLNKQFDNKLVEKNSSLGVACMYMLKHWEALTQFLRIAGAPLDNNIVERALKGPIRVRKNSLFYATEHGAYLGSVLQSIIQTCIAAKQNPVAYLTALQENKTAVKADPSVWMPWNYLATLAVAA
jgi:transposase